MSSSAASGTKSLISGRAVVGALAEADRVHQGQRADRLGQPALDELDAGDEGGGDGAEADGEDAEAPVGRLHGRGRRSASRSRRLGVGARPVAPAVPPGDGDRDGRHGPARRAARGPAAKRIEAAGSPPICLATVLVGDDAPSQRYVRSKQRKATEIGMRPRHVDLPATASQGQVEAAVAELAADPDVHGILVQLPLPAGLDPDAGDRPDPAGEGRRRAHRALDGPPRARRARPRRLHAARRDAPARALRRGDRRPPGRRRRPLAAGRAAARRCCWPARASTPR